MFVQRESWAGILLSCLLTSFCWAADIPAQLRIDRVTVYRETASVARAGTIDIPQGDHRLIIRWLPDATERKASTEVRATVRAESALSVPVIIEYH